MAVWLLLVLIAACATAYLLWAYRRRSAAACAASRERLAALLAEAAAGRTAAQGGAKTPARLLGPEHALAYYLLKAALPEHEIFARVSAAAVPGTSGGSKRELDLVVCDKAMRVVAVVELSAQATGGHAVAERGDGGVRKLRWNPAALPRREAVRAMVCGTAL